MSFTFNENIPAGGNNPSDDQPIMQTNNVSTKGILAVDHITFGTLGGGEHQKVTFNSRTLAPAATDPKAYLYTNTVIASGTNTASASTVSELFFRNQNAGAAANSFPVSMIKAFGTFDAAGNSLNTWNMSATFAAPATYTITMPANIVTGEEYLVFISKTAGGGATSEIYNILSATQFEVTFTLPFALPPTKFSVMVMQL